MAELKRAPIQIGLPVDDAVLRQEISKYEQVRDRVTRFNNKKNMSDKEIIEKQEAEIEYYRHKIELLTKVHRENVEVIREQDKEIEELKNKKTEISVYADREELKEINEISDSDIKQIETITTFAGGKLIESITKYKYKEDKENDCPPIPIGMHASG